MKVNTKNYSKIISQVLVDDREKERVDYALSQYEGLNPLKSHLDYGDYIFIGENNLRVVFEYKTGSDFLSSINSRTNHSLHNQVYDMITNEDYTFVIIECDDMQKQMEKLYYSTGINVAFQQVNGEISEYCTVSTVLQAQTRFQAFDLMMRVAGKIIKDQPYRWKFGKKTANAALNYLSSIHGLENLAADIVYQYALRTHEDLMELTFEDLLNVDGIGKHKANIIWKQLHG